MSQSQTIPIILNLIAALFGAAGQYFYKIGAHKMKLVPIYQNWSIFLGVLSFCIVMTLFVVSYRMGGKISIVFPMYATTFLWGTLFEIVLEKQNLTMPQWLGTALVIIGISVIAIFSKQVA